MELYTNSRPILINESVAHYMDGIVETIKEQNIGVVQKIMDTYIYPNIGFCIICIIIASFLIYRYLKNKTNDRKEIFTKLNNGHNTQHCDSNNIINNNYGIKIFDEYDAPNERIARPLFNPSKPIDKQISYTKYLPDEIPVNVNRKIINNVHKTEYIAPQYNPNTFQYTGPFYNNSNSGTSDEMYAGFVDENARTLFEFDDLLEDKINVN